VRRRQAIVGLAIVAAVLIPAGWRTATSTVQHASIGLGNVGPGGVPLVVDVWSDPSTGEIAFRIQGDTDVDLLRARTIFDVTDGRLAGETVYQRAGDAWTIIHERYGLTSARTTAALAAGETVPRPPLMTVPKPDSIGFIYSRDFGTDLAALRNAARFPVPSPGPRLDSRVLAHASLDRVEASNVGPGNLAVIIYSSNPAKLGAGDTEVLLNAAPPTSPSGSSYATFFAKSRHRISGVDARITSLGDVILRYHGSYVLVRMDENASDSHWRAVLAGSRARKTACYPPAVMDRWLARIFGQNG
jgi:hypothetical protein